MTKLCIKCGETKEAELFCNNKLIKGGKAVYCKQCEAADRKISMNKQWKVYGHLSVEDIYELAGDIMKRCPRCKISKQPNEFGVDRHRKGGLFTSCKECHRIECAGQSVDPDKRKIVEARSYKKRRDSIERKYTVYKSAAKKRKWSFPLSIDEFRMFWNKQCTYCGNKIETIGLDRINSLIGYELTNIASCCIICNRMKTNMTLDEWTDKMLQILKFLGKV